MRPRLFSAALAATASVLALGGGTAPLPQASALQASQGVSWSDGARFLMQSSFGPTDASIRRVRAVGYAAWIEEQARKPARDWTPRVRSLNEPTRNVVVDLFWENAIEGEDELRARVAYALSNIVTASLNEDLFYDNPESFTHYYDALNRHALGNYGDVIREVSLSPGMGIYLSHLANRKADPEAGVAPDENYAREVMQLFTIGLEELRMDGTPRGGETYTTEDVEGLAAVFTGLSYDGDRFEWPTNLDERVRSIPMVGFAEHHEPGAKSFLGATVPEGTDAEASVDAALGHLLSHPNLAPFVAGQMIQHLVTSNPKPAYVARVARAFEAGSFTSDGVTFGEGRRGDMLATVAAILLDDEARSRTAAARADFGRVRDPILRFAHVTRAFRDDGGAPFAGKPPDTGAMHYAQESYVLGQKALSPPSVFGWYRPGYVSPGGWTAGAGKVAPEMQLATASNLTGYIGWMHTTVESKVWGTDFFDLDYAKLERYKDDPERLVLSLDRRLTGGTMSEQARTRIAEAVALVPEDSVSEWSGVDHRVGLALLMVVTSPDYVVQR